MNHLTFYLIYLVAQLYIWRLFSVRAHQTLKIQIIFCFMAKRGDRAELRVKRHRWIDGFSASQGDERVLND